MTDATSPTAHVVPAFGWSGLPGLYSPAWPTPFGLEGEATREQADRAVEGGGFEIVTLDHATLTQIWDRYRLAVDPATDQPSTSPVLDEAAIAEQVASQYPRSRDVRTAERHVERMYANASAHEYRHLASGDAERGGKLPLPPLRD